jgi:Fe-S-cluster containining protein
MLKTREDLRPCVAGDFHPSDEGFISGRHAAEALSQCQPQVMPLLNPGTSGLRMSRNTNPTTCLTQCLRCGTCCRKGGPALHLEDKALVDAGKIPLKHLMTFRQGEPVYDNITGTIAPAVTDIIKIKGIHGGTAVCAFYDAATKGCAIYPHRPAECDALLCRDTREIEKIYAIRRLTRRHLLSGITGYWELVQDHQQRCDYAYIAELAGRIRQQQQAAAAEKALLELVAYDRHLRAVTLERSHFDPGVLEFFFGRPLSFTMGLFHLRIKKTGSGARIEAALETGQQICYRRL